MDGQKSITLRTLALDSHNSELLTVVCSKALDVYVNTNNVVDRDFEDCCKQTIRLKVDQGKIVRQAWLQSDNEKGLFSMHPKTLLEVIKPAHTLYFEYRPFEGSPQTLEFDVEMLAQQMHKHYECQRLGF